MQGNAEAAFQLGLLYDLGTGVSPDATFAYRYHMQAARAGVPEAEFNVAVMNDNGQGVRRDPAAAAIWYARAAAHGHIRAAYDIAMLYAGGEGVPRNAAESAVWRNAAALPQRMRDSDPQFAAPELAGRAAGPLRPPIMAPPDTQSEGGGRAIELVWITPPQSVPTTYVVEIVAGPELVAARPKFTASTQLTAVLTPRLQPGHYVWRVYAVCLHPPHYAGSAWSQFTVGD